MIEGQVWIGCTGPADAIFVPPHHQCETIHPFLDGNGRMGRLLIPLFLVDGNILDKPLLYLSSYLERNKELYYDNLTFVRTKNDMTQWLKYFLVGIGETASNAAKTLSQIIQLKSDTENLVNERFGRKSNSAILLLQ